MFLHKSVLITEVNVKNPDPVFGQKLLTQFGGATGELTAALTYWTQSFHTTIPGIRDMLQDIGTEEFSHLEVIAILIEQHTTRATANVRDAAYNSTLFALRGPGPHLVDDQGTYWDGRYVVEGGHVVRDLRANVSAEAGALNTYEALLRITDDEGTRKALNVLATREVSHQQMFMEALASLNAVSEPLFGDLQPGPTVNLYFNMSSGTGADLRGPWNSEPAFQYVADPVQHLAQRQGGNNAASNEMLAGEQLANAPQSTQSMMGQGPRRGGLNPGLLGEKTGQGPTNKSSSGSAQR
jgi:Mn-containing catalase